jgi:hypothetical protein
MLRREWKISESFHLFSFYIFSAVFCVMTSRERKYILENVLKKTPNNAYEQQRKRKALNWLNTSNFIEKK